VAYTQKERYYLLKAKGMCVICGKNRAVPGRVNCPDCRQKNIDRIKSKYQKNREIILLNARIRTQELKRKGLCHRCGRPKGNTTNAGCQNCTEHLDQHHPTFNPAIFYPGGKYENYNKRGPNGL
jgi:hypothetical protein